MGSSARLRNMFVISITKTWQAETRVTACNHVIDTRTYSNTHTHTHTQKVIDHSQG